MNSKLTPAKRYALSHIGYVIDAKRWSNFSEDHWFPLSAAKATTVVSELPPDFCTQNVHPFLRFYKHDLSTETMSHDELSILLRPWI